MEELNIDLLKHTARESFEEGAREGVRIATEVIAASQAASEAAEDARAEALNRYNALMARGQGAEAAFVYLKTIHGKGAGR